MFVIVSIVGGEIVMRPVEVTFRIILPDSCSQVTVAVGLLTTAHSKEAVPPMGAKMGDRGDINAGKPVIK